VYFCGLLWLVGGPWHFTRVKSSAIGWKITHRDISIKGLSPAFEGIKIEQLSDIHMDEFTEPFLLREAINRVNRERPDYVFLTGD
jgi:predicted MPP superfamily phosphohydrolase